MGLASLPNPLTNGTLADGAEVFGNDVALRDAVNNIEDVNLAANAVKNAKINNDAKPSLRFTDNGGQGYIVNADNFLSSTSSGDLNFTIDAFVAYILGIRVNKSSIANLYTASRDTYVDVDSAGAVVFNAVANGAVQPAQVAGTLRIVKVVTDGTTVTLVTVLPTGIAFPAQIKQEYRYIECNIAKNTGDVDVLGNQKLKVVFRGKDNTGIHDLDTGAAGIELDFANKELPNGMDVLGTPSAKTFWSIWVIGAADGSQPIATLASQVSTPLGVGNPLYPTGYDIGRWVGLIMFNNTPILIPSVQIGLETVFHENQKDTFLAANNGTWTIYDFDANFAPSDYVGMVLLHGSVSNFGETGFANHGVTGATAPSTQPGARIIAKTALSSSTDENSMWVPLSIDAKVNIWHNSVADGTGVGQQGGETTPFGISLMGWKYKNF